MHVLAEILEVCIDVAMDRALVATSWTRAIIALLTLASLAAGIWWLGTVMRWW